MYVFGEGNCIIMSLIIVFLERKFSGTYLPLVILIFIHGKVFLEGRAAVIA